MIHETIHALTHLGRALDGRMWQDFSLPSARSLLFEPSWLHETLAQYFTPQQILRLRDLELLHAFETLSGRQAPAYRTWRRLSNLPAEEMRSWFMSIPPQCRDGNSFVPDAFRGQRRGLNCKVWRHIHPDGCRALRAGGPNPGADDNASGTAGLLELARLLDGRPLAHRVELVAYANEEPHYLG
ncbi:MAG TPA: M28 family peptidase, partial [Thermoanaerobaculia bacterium]|nr:M28 family peptidase [Thermoanaerobaculia bacterium]